MTDADLELLIEWHSRHLLRCCEQGDRDGGREHWRLLVVLIAGRSEEQVERMEQAIEARGK